MSDEVEVERTRSQKILDRSQKIIIRSRGGVTKVLIGGRQIEDVVSLSLEQDADKPPGSLGDPVLTLKIRVWDLWVDSDDAKIEATKATPADGAEDLLK